MAKAFLTQPPHSSDGTKRFINGLTEGKGLEGVGGFSLVCGKVGESLAVISNRTPNLYERAWISRDKDETIGLSNAAPGDKSWPKVLRGEALLSSAIKQDFSEQRSQASLIERLFRILDDDMLPKKPDNYPWDSYVRELRKSIFIPAIGGEGVEYSRAEDLAAAQSDQHVHVERAVKDGETRIDLEGLYGTQKQTVVLVGRQGRVTFVERTLYDPTDSVTAAPYHDRAFHFDIEGWEAQNPGDAEGE